jgi:hypothetical protein
VWLTAPYQSLVKATVRELVAALASTFTIPPLPRINITTAEQFYALLVFSSLAEVVGATTKFEFALAMPGV